MFERSGVWKEITLSSLFFFFFFYFNVKVEAPLKNIGLPKILSPIIGTMAWGPIRHPRTDRRTLLNACIARAYAFCDLLNLY